MSSEIVCDACFNWRDPENTQGVFWWLWGVFQVKWCCPTCFLIGSYLSLFSWWYCFCVLILVKSISPVSLAFTSHPYELSMFKVSWKISIASLGSLSWCNEVFLLMFQQWIFLKEKRLLLKPLEIVIFFSLMTLFQIKGSIIKFACHFVFWASTISHFKKKYRNAHYIVRNGFIFKSVNH